MTSEDTQSWPRHFRATVTLALPLIGAQLAQMAMGVTDTIMLGWLGAVELAASVLATQAFFLLFIFGGGFADAAVLSPPTPKAAATRAACAARSAWASGSSASTAPPP